MIKPPFYHYVAEEVSCKLGCQWKCGNMLIFFGVCEVECHFKTMSKWTTKLFLGRPLHRENMPKRFKKDDSLVCLYLGSLVFMDREVQIPISRSIWKMEGDKGF